LVLAGIHSAAKTLPPIFPTAVESRTGRSYFYFHPFLAPPKTRAAWNERPVRECGPPAIQGREGRKDEKKVNDGKNEKEKAERQA
jgi:hypothetical protein